MKSNEVFVFGSNLKGLHGGGAARAAMNKFGAIWGQGVGLQGQSYAIPTVGVGLGAIHSAVERFTDYAMQHPEKLRFRIRRRRIMPRSSMVENRK